MATTFDFSMQVLQIDIYRFSVTKLHMARMPCAAGYAAMHGSNFQLMLASDHQTGTSAMPGVQSGGAVRKCDPSFTRCLFG
jgi:hypothetical protein